MHASSGMNQKHLLRFIKKTMKNSKDDVVCRDKNGQEMTLAEVRFVSGQMRFSVTIKFLCNVRLVSLYLSVYLIIHVS